LAYISKTMKLIPKAILFDFDGTLAVLTLDFTKMRHAAIAALRGFLSADELAHYDAERPVMEALDLLDKRLPASRSTEARAVVEKALIDFEVEAAKLSRLYTFTLPALTRLREKNIPCAIITRNCRASVETVFPNHADYCAQLLTRHDVKNIKPHPDHLLGALAPLGVAPADALMVGDHPMDIVAAKNAGCQSAGVLTGEAGPELMAAAEPDYLANDVGELMKMLGL
jgi:phosphoglycolate phosphatase